MIKKQGGEKMNSKKKNVLIAFGDRKPALREQMVETFQKNDFNVLQSNCSLLSDIQEEVENINNEYGDIHVLIYFPQPPFKMSILDANFSDKVASQIHEDLETGVWWIQTVGKSMASRGNRGSIILLSHITSIVPTQKFSYCSTSQAALMNVAKVGVFDTKKHDISINIVVTGWSEDKNEKEFVEQLREVHQNDNNPLLPYTAEQEVAQVCIDLSKTKGINGTTITVDGGFSITRPIRQFNDAEKQVDLLMKE